MVIVSITAPGREDVILNVISGVFVAVLIATTQFPYTLVPSEYEVMLTVSAPSIISSIASPVFT